jgi:hypothetical protein
MDRNCITYWLPKLEIASVPVPNTEIIRWPGTKWSLVNLCHGPTSAVPPEWEGFVESLMGAAERVGGGRFQPVFLRTGHGSGKHDWRNTCCVHNQADIGLHVARIVEWSHLVDMMGLPHDVWAVREMLPVRPVAVLPRYGGFPLTRELRCFVEGGEVVCHHDYWPEGAISQGLNEGSEAKIQAIISGSRLSPAEKKPALELAAKVAWAFEGDGAWSVDVLETQRGWYVTDMAEAGASYHWKSCPHIERKWETGACL